MTTSEGHLNDCDGNGWVTCWECLGEGVLEIEDDETEVCENCRGRGGFICPACDRPDDAA